ncbi:MAG: hypothetical protein LUQ11_06090 [Methylococcaceae bacterium]|nr:hypothetical protein [Methylococcaceae bacterium]
MTHISPFFETLEQARKFKANAIATNPDCFVEDRVEFFSSENDVNRKALLAQIVKANQAV